MFTNKFRDAEFGGDIEFWSKDQKFGVRFKISSADEIYNGAVLEVITPAKKDKVPTTEVTCGPDSRVDSFSNKAEWPGSRPPVPISDVMLCSVHKKRRTLMNLMKDDDDNWVCVPDSVCKTGTSSNTREQTCSIHGKVRTLSNLQKKNGEWVCLQRAQCKGFGVEQRPSYFSSFRSSNGQFVPLSDRGGLPGRGALPERGGFRPSNGQLGPLPQRGGYQGGPDDWSRDRASFAQICSIHGKERSMNNLINDGGRWVCDPAFECKGGPIVREPRPIVREPRPIVIREQEQMGRPRFRDNFDGNLRPGYELYRRAFDPPDSPQRYRSAHDPPIRQDPEYGRFSPREREYSPGFEPRRDDFGLLGRRRDFPSPGFGPRRDDFGLPARRREMPIPRRRGNGPRNSGLICRIHGKYRSRGNMMSTKNGAWECLPSSECK